MCCQIQLYIRVLFYKYPEWRSNDNFASYHYDTSKWANSEVLNKNIPQTNNQLNEETNENNNENSNEKEENLINWRINILCITVY